MTTWTDTCRYEGSVSEERLPSILKMMAGSTKAVLSRRLEQGGELVSSVDLFSYELKPGLLETRLVVKLGESGMTAEEAFDGLVTVPGDTNA